VNNHTIIEWNCFFSFENIKYERLKNLKDVDELVKKVDEGQEPEQVLTEYLNSFEQENKY